MENQQKVWNNIAEEWQKFKETPSEFSQQFLKSCTGKVLDLGSGTGRHLTKINNGKMYLIDFSEEMINLAKRKQLNLRYLQNLLLQIFPKNSLFRIIFLTMLFLFLQFIVSNHKIIRKQYLNYIEL